MLVRDVTSHVLFTLIKIIKHYQIQRNRVKYRHANVSVKIIKHYQIQRKCIKHVFAKLAKDLLIMLLKAIFVGGFPRFLKTFFFFFYSSSLYGGKSHSIISVSSGTC